MRKLEYPHLEEQLYCGTLENGLTVKVVPKQGFRRKVAYFATNFGAIHRDFELEGQMYHTPAGVAHFLEHKMFELPGRDVPAEFAALGANVNAFTSFDMTAYYFSCTENFEQALALLLEFVSTPYFTPESVLREIGIIDQEIAMNEDEPETGEFELLMGKMYRAHPVREPILGTRGSIREITDETLYLCHRAFYTPANMVLTVVGDVDPEKIEQIARQVLPTQYREPGRKCRSWQEPMWCDAEPAVQNRDVSEQTFQLGFKSEPASSGADTIRTDIVGYLAAELLMGDATELYEQLYDRRIIGSSFGGSFETIDGCAMLTCGGDSDDPEQVRRALLERSAQMVREGIDQGEFLRLKRGVMGRRIRDLDSFDALCFRICAYHFLDFDYLRFPEVYADVTEEDVRSFLERVVNPQRCAMAITQPLPAK